MYNTSELLSLIANVKGADAVSLASLQTLSLSEIRNKFRDVLSYSQARHLFREAQEQLKKNKILESRIFTRVNPQLPHAIRSGIRDNAASRSYVSMFGSRSSSFVKPGSVASMFSPAGYLTELYREARGLHADDSAYNLDVRRPDLAGLVLSQENMDEEISTLTLSNDIMLSHVEKKSGTSGDKLLEKFATDRFSSATPYHQPYEILRQSVLTLDPELDALVAAPDVLSKADNASLLSIIANISPELHDILVENIDGDDDELSALYKKNFPLPAEYFLSDSNIKDYYNLSEKEQTAFLGNADDVLLGGSHGYEGALYVDGRLKVATLAEDGSAIIYQFSKGDTHNPNQFQYIELLPLGGLKFEVRYCVTETRPSMTRFCIKTSSDVNDKNVLYSEDNFVPVINKHYSHEITLTLEQINKGVTIGLWREEPNTNNHWWCSQHISIQALSFNAYMLKLNKAIRFCRATGITPEQLESIVYSAGSDGKVDESVITLLFNALYLRQRYNTDLDKGLVLATANISQFTGSAEVSQFDRLFNSPALAGEWFSADGSEINPAPDATDNVFARDNLLRGLNITRGELYQLVLMAGLNDDKGKLELTLENISILYRLSLVARLNGLTVNELYLLFTVSPFTDATSVAFVQYAYQMSHWMTDAGLSATEVWTLTSTVYPATLTPEMKNLRSAIEATDVENAEDDVSRRRFVAPHIAGALGLPSPDMAASLILWCENAGCFTLDNFLKLLLTETLKPEDEEPQLAEYLHVLGQYSLTVLALSLSEAEVSVLAGIPGARQLLPDVAQDNALARLMSLHYFHQWLNTLGRESSAILAALNEGKLTIALMASAMGQDEAVLAQALSCVDENASAESTLGNWQTIYQILQWVNVATALNTMPAVVKQLVDIRLSGKADEQPSWEEWKNLSRSLEAALTQRQAATLAASTAERLSDVLCSWFLVNVTDSDVSLNSRDDLYSYFLIDNQVSSEVTTTRLAEAISGIQLYINRALNRIEPNVLAGVSTRQFFIDWEMNSRYSTWGGISRLAYYPENYVDPLQRIGQTKMMDELLQYINQSQLSEDTVEDAFKAYLARFETIADLKVISAYHDNVNSDSGKTWFIGRARGSVGEYYWRNVNMSRFSEGKLAANAWSEWVKIEAPVLAWKDTVRPVIFRDRLYVVWIEREEIAQNDFSGNPVLSYRYSLKLIFLRHDDNWSSPWSFDITSQIAGILGGTMSDQDNGTLGLAASCFQGEDTLMILAYKLQDKYDFKETSTPESMRGMFIYADGVIKDSDDTSSKVINYFSSMVNTLDITLPTTPSGIARRACYRFAADYDVPTRLEMGTATGDYDLTTVAGNVLNIGQSTANSKLKLSLLNPHISVDYRTTSSTMSRQVRAMKLLGIKDGTKFTTIGSYNKDQGIDLLSAIGAVNNGNFECFASVMSGIVPYNHYQMFTCKKSSTKLPTYILVRCQHYGTGIVNSSSILGSTYDDFSFYPLAVEVSVINYPPLFAFSTINSVKMIEFDLAVDPANVTVTATSGSKTDIFKASDKVSDLPVQGFDMNYNFSELQISGESLNFVNNRALLDITYEAKAKDGRSLGKVSKTLTINRSSYEPQNILQLMETDVGVQYMQYGPYRIRLNTLLAPQLVSRANTGINAILSMETQSLPEPALPKPLSFDAQFTLPAYDEKEHGTSREVIISVGNVHGDTTLKPHWNGILSDTKAVISLSIPYQNPTNEGVRVGVKLGDKNYTGSWQQAFFYRRGDGVEDYDDAGNYEPKDGYVPGDYVLINDKDYNLTWTLKGKLAAKKYQGFVDVNVIRNYEEPLDFNSACALYYWELFYYVPMMCFRRFLDEKKFSEARTWLNYIWNPNGYIVNGETAPWAWNCRPLEETISWNANPLDAIDPDAVAQNDPTHYKVATFMSFIELLVTRGDMCYRELTRDALNEAKMWYVQALRLMGDEPQDHGSTTWTSPSLATAASETTRIAYQDMLATIESDIAFPDAQVEGGGGSDSKISASVGTEADASAADEKEAQTRTANSLTDLFLPELNPALTDMWATLRLRLYNLRHNLSIDGQPLSLSIYADPADPAALLSSMVQTSAGGAALPKGTLSLYRFPVMLERARNLVGQLTQFGSNLLNLVEHQDADELNSILLQQGMELLAQSLRIQQNTVDEVNADISALQESRRGAEFRLDKYTRLYNEDVSSGEKQAMALSDSAAALSLAAQPLMITGGALNAIPNIYGMACGGSEYGAPSIAIGSGLQMLGSSQEIQSNKISRSENYRRRREEWEIQRDNAQSEINQIDAQLAGMAIRLEAAKLQVGSLETQQGHTLAQMEFMQRKFTNQALYNWMRGKLSAIYYQFFDIAQSCCLMAQEALRRELNDNKVTFIRGSAWNGATAGFMAGETLLLNLAEMDKAWMERDERALEVTRTVSLAQVYAGLSDPFNFRDQVVSMVGAGSGNKGSDGNILTVNANKELTASVKLSGLNIKDDYKSSLGATRRIKQVSVTLPALVGPYEDVRAVLSYGGSVVMPRGCNAIAVSHGMNDSGQFQLDFNDARFLPFEGVPVDDTGTLTLSFPDATTRQKALLESLNDIILHIRYTIQS